MRWHNSSRLPSPRGGLPRTSHLECLLPEQPRACLAQTSFSSHLKCLLLEPPRGHCLVDHHMSHRLSLPRAQTSSNHYLEPWLPSPGAPLPRTCPCSEPGFPRSHCYVSSPLTSSSLPSLWNFKTSFSLPTNLIFRHGWLEKVRIFTSIVELNHLCMKTPYNLLLWALISSTTGWRGALVGTGAEPPFYGLMAPQGLHSIFKIGDLLHAFYVDQLVPFVLLSRRKRV